MERGSGSDRAEVLNAFRRWWYSDVVERRSAARLPVGADGIITGAESISIDGPPDAPAALILHGFGDTPQSVEPLARALAARGWTVSAPLLAGHGRTLREFAASGGDEWLASARDALRALAPRTPRLFVAGQSLGGALATILAAESAEIRSVALLAPYLDASASVRIYARLAPVLGVLAPYLTTNDDRSLHDPEARARALSFGVTTPRLTRELLRVADRATAEFPSVPQPVLYLQSRMDNRVSPEVAERACASRPGTVLEWVPSSGHVLTDDFERDRVAARIAEWFAAS